MLPVENPSHSDIGGPFATPVGYTKSYHPLHNAVIRVYHDAGNVIETHEHAGDFKEW